MSHASHEVKKQLEATIAALEEFRDETRVKLHLAGMEARDRWNELEPHLLDVQDRARKVASKLDDIAALLTGH
ncbi:hypothetical protein LZC95_35495 [Pendulispora brunnea]|uniref:Uncharacterized protein n=1 Tax=Pendulispora brunnea TaxID=2905690 RepID=A0ABZ2K126_9BACT